MINHHHLLVLNDNVILADKSTICFLFIPGLQPGLLFGVLRGDGCINLDLTAFATKLHRNRNKNAEAYDGV